jgi:hypothetical protein
METALPQQRPASSVNLGEPRSRGDAYASTESLPAVQPIDGEPRVRDIDLAERLGFDRPRDIRKLIERNLPEVETFGLARRRGASIKSGKGRVSDVVEFWLNEEQALLVATLSQAERAPAVRAMLIRVFVAYRRGQLPAMPAPRLGDAAGEASSVFGSYFNIAKMIGLDPNQSALAAAKATRKATGLDVLNDMGVTLIAPQQELMLTPSDICQRLGLLSPHAANQLLADRGFQIGRRDFRDRLAWEPTSTGKPLSVVLDVGKQHSDGTPIRQVKWATSILDHLQPSDARAAL